MAAGGEARRTGEERPMRAGIRGLIVALAAAWPLLACSSGANLPPLSGNPQNAASTYRLGPGDQLSLKVVSAEDLTGDYPVSDGGTISVPLIGEVKAAGLTSTQLEKEIVDKLAQGYLRNPRVNVSIKKYRPFYIYGEVAKPGEYPYASGMRVLNAIATAGGYTYRAAKGYVVVTRNGRDAKALDATPIEPDDVIQVPERMF
jgi:polysaccharide export outer membrane protein